MPLAPDGYQFYRNVRDFGAKGDGVTDDTDALNRAAMAFNAEASFDPKNPKGRCGLGCGQTTVLQAVGILV